MANDRNVYSGVGGGKLSKTQISPPEGQDRYVNLFNKMRRVCLVILTFQSPPALTRPHKLWPTKFSSTGCKNSKHILAILLLFMMEIALKGVFSGKRCNNGGKFAAPRTPHITDYVNYVLLSDEGNGK